MTLTTDIRIEFLYTFRITIKLMLIGQYNTSACRYTVGGSLVALWMAGRRRVAIHLDMHVRMYSFRDRESAGNYSVFMVQP